MPTGRYTANRRTAFQVASDAEAERLARALGRMLRDGRGPNRRQADVAATAGLAQTTFSLLERGAGANVSLKVWTRAARATGVDLRAYLERTTAAGEPRDAVHLRHQELVARTARTGGWEPRPEMRVDAGLDSRAADLVLRRSHELALIEIVDWVSDGGAELRAWDRRLARLRTSHEAVRVSGCLVLRATRRNRRLVSDHPTLFDAVFPAPSGTWIRALSAPDVPMPSQSGLVWVSVEGSRLFPRRG